MFNDFAVYSELAEKKVIKSLKIHKRITRKAEKHVATRRQSWSCRSRQISKRCTYLSFSDATHAIVRKKYLVLCTLLRQTAYLLRVLLPVDTVKLENVRWEPRETVSTRLMLTYGFAVRVEKLCIRNERDLKCGWRQL